MTRILVAMDAIGITTLTLDCSGSGWMDTHAAEELGHALHALAQDAKARVLILSGVGEVFCGPVAAEAVPAFFEALETLRALRIPIVAAVGGMARGLGASLAASADIIVAADAAVFCLDGLDAGELPPAQTLRRLMPQRLLRFLVLTGEEIGAARLHGLGGIDQVVPRTALAERAQALAMELAQKSPSLIRLLKDAIALTEELPLAAAQKAEVLYTTLASGTADAREAAAAFLEKRKPQWRAL